MTRPPALLVDVDGTLTEHRARDRDDETELHLDRPSGTVLTIVRAIYKAGYPLVLVSGRTEAARPATEAWLDEHLGEYSTLLLREADDRRPDEVIKAELFEVHVRGKWDVLAVFDDRRAVVDMWRGMGLTVPQVAPGNF